jgi:two-component system, NtrC family, sensor kinase
MTNVLIIDDSLTVRMDLKVALESAGFVTTPCATLQEARQRLTHGSVGLMILDVLLPDGDGLEFLREIRSVPGTAAVAVMLLSTEAELRGRLRGLSINAEDYLGKPYDREQVIARVRKVLERPEPVAGHAAPGLAGRKLLAVDDSPTYLDALTTQLCIDGIEVLAARSGEEALHVLAAQSVDCILLDLLMPGLSGQETCRRIKSTPAWRGIPVLMLTGSEEPAAMIASFDAGADDFISKSGDFSVLRARLRAQLRRKESEEENQRIREQLHQKEVEAKAAAIANQAKDHFLAVLSHELRTPLTPVLATVAMLESNPGQSADMRHSLEVIRRNVELEARLIDDLLDVTRIARGKVELDKRPIELCTIIERAVEVCQPDIDARQLHFGVDIGPDAPYLLEADAARLQQVFWNLLKNAIKFTPKGGCVGIRCRRQGEGFVLAEVNDSGEGIDPAALGRIFNAFEQAERSITRQFGGLGLGLTISKTLVEMHGGCIQAHSQGKGRGATFTVQLPLHSAEVAASRTSRASAAQARNPPGRPLRILLVEDHGDTARVMCRLLSANGHAVQTAADVVTALKLTEQHAFDLLLSDLGLPDGSGLDLMRALRARGLDVPGIALSGYGQEKDIQQARDAGFLAHLTKPVSLPRLMEAIAKAVGARS